MFSSAVKKVYMNTPGTEGNDVRVFLKNSEELKKMRLIASTERTKLAEQNNFCKTISDLESAVTFAKILEVTDRFDFQNTNDPSVKNLGRHGMNAMLFLGGFVSNEANMAYYLLHLRENAIQVMANKGYSADDTHSVSEAIHRM